MTKYQVIMQARYSIILFLAMFFCAPLMIFGATGDVDLSFNAGVISSQFSQDRLTAIAVQTDGKILIGGLFNVVAGAPRNGLVRLNADGSVDAGFVPPPFSTGDLVNPYKIAVQTDGKIVVAGNNFRIGGIVYQVIRLNADGSLDASFSLLPINAFRGVEGLALQPDGKILIGGDFTFVDGVSRKIAARLNSNGTLDASFAVGVAAIAHDGRAEAFVIEPDGKIIVGGLLFVTVGTTNFLNVVRLDSNGAPDATFNVAGDSLDAVHALVRQPDGKILIAADGSGNTGSRKSLARVNSNGSIDASFNSTVSTGGQVYGIALEPTGKIIAVGNFCTLPFGQGCGLARFNTDGSRDTFYPFNAACGTQGFDNQTLAVVRQPDGKILVGGRFSNVSCFPRQRIARLQTDTNVTISNVSQNEGNSGATAFNFTVSLSSAAQTVTVNYATADGMANSPVDYQALNGVLSFAPGETSKTVSVSVNSDTTVEPNETFTVNLSGAVNATITGAVGTGTIINDDLCAYSIAPTSLTIGAGGGAGNTISVTTQAGCAYNAVSNNAFITITSGAGDAGSGTVAFAVAANAGAARTGTMTVSGQTFTVNQAASPTFRKTPFDFDGDGRADVSVFRASAGTWYLLNSTAGFSATQFGFPTDKIVPADYDGDGKTDIAVYRPSSGIWYFLNSTTGFGAVQFGFSTDIPLPADYDGDGKADVAVYRPSTGTWYVLQSTGGHSITQFGFSSDLPIPADYDGDGKADIAVYRPSLGIWFILKSTGGFNATQFGFSTDKIVPADYDGDGKTDIAVYRPSSGTWFLLQSTAGFLTVRWGVATDIPVPADYDGDGRTDAAVYRPSQGTWYLLLPASFPSARYEQFGFSTDQPIPDAFAP